jgi:hypothetical protein
MDATTLTTGSTTGMTDTSGMGGIAAMHALATQGGTGYGHGAGFAGAGLGATGAILGGLALLSNLGRNGGLFGGNGNGTLGTGANLVTTTDLQAALNAQSQSQNTNNILQQLAAIQQEIPSAEGRSQLALAQAQIGIQTQAAQGQLAAANTAAQLSTNVADARHSINDNVHLNGLNNANSFAGVQIGIANSTAATNAIVRETKDVVESNFANANLQAAQYQAATALGIANLGLQNAVQTGVIQTSIRDDGDRTRSLIIAQNDATLNRLLTTAQNEIIELKNDRTSRGHSRETELNITQNVNQNNLQNQQQQQQQQQFLLLSNLAQQIAGLTQIAKSTNSNIIAGNSGATVTGAQTSTPTNVNA